jgi:hypothetical protein
MLACLLAGGHAELISTIILHLLELVIGVAQEDQPNTGIEYSDDFNLELARRSSAASHRRFSISVVLAGIRFLMMEDEGPCAVDCMPK